MSQSIESVRNEVVKVVREATGPVAAGDVVRQVMAHLNGVDREVVLREMRRATVQQQLRWDTKLRLVAVR
jgi:hypothetical protein